MELIEIKDFIANILDLHQAKQEENFAIIDMKLDQIVEEKKNINIRLEKLESKVRTIEDNLLEKKSVNKWIVTSLSVLGAALGIVLTALKIFGK
jgi:hypothetical protein